MDCMDGNGLKLEKNWRNLATSFKFMRFNIYSRCVCTFRLCSMSRINPPAVSGKYEAVNGLENTTDYQQNEEKITD